MYTYKTVRVELGGFLTRKPKQDCQQIIDDHAKLGWRLVQIFAPAIHGYGSATYYDIIFEMEVKN